MELKKKLNELHERVDGLKENISTEEATKNAFIMPFIQILGYDIFNPIEVIPEFTADIGTKKGEKVDYAIMIDNQPAIIIECKHWKEDLDRHNSQIHRYFNVTKSKFAILTNGIQYEFYTDLEKSNIMDVKPFLQINLDKLKDNNINELTKFHKDNFNLDKILSSANSLKYIKAITIEFEKELNEPSDEFTKLLVGRFFNGVVTSKRLEAFKDYAKKAIKTSINDTINSRLHIAFAKEQEEQIKNDVNIELEETSKIITTEEELEAFEIIKAILRKVTPKENIAYRDTQSYFGVLFQDNNRKPICRLYLDTKQKRISLFDENKTETKYNIESIDDIYNYSEELINTIKFYS